MHQNAVLSIASNDSRNVATDVVGAVTSSPTQQNDKREQSWVAEIEPLSIFIHSLGHSYVASLIDRHLRCTVELPVESDLESAKNSALTYAEQYMHFHIGEASWLLPKAAQWTEFIAVRSAEDLQQRISDQRSPTTVSRLAALAPPAQSSRQSGPATTRPFVLNRPDGYRPTLFLSLSEAGRYTGLSVPFLKRKIDSGELPAIKDRGWRVRRSDLHKI